MAKYIPSVPLEVLKERGKKKARQKKILFGFLRFKKTNTKHRIAAAKNNINCSGLVLIQSNICHHPFNIVI